MRGSIVESLNYRWVKWSGLYMCEVLAGMASLTPLLLFTRYSSLGSYFLIPLSYLSSDTCRSKAKISIYRGHLDSNVGPAPPFDLQKFFVIILLKLLY